MLKLGKILKLRKILELGKILELRKILELGKMRPRIIRPDKVKREKADGKPQYTILLLEA